MLWFGTKQSAEGFADNNRSCTNDTKQGGKEEEREGGISHRKLKTLNTQGPNNDYLIVR